MNNKIILIVFLFNLFIIKAQNLKLSNSSIDFLNGKYVANGKTYDEDSNTEYTKYYFENNSNIVLEWRCNWSCSGWHIMDKNTWEVYFYSNSTALSPELVLDWLDNVENSANINLQVVDYLSSNSLIFKENNSDDGAIDNSILITLVDVENLDSFTGNLFDDFILQNKVIVNDIPEGLTAKIIKTANNQLTFSLDGVAINHEQHNSIFNITIQFLDSAFVLNDASKIDNNLNFSIIYKLFSGGNGSINDPYLIGNKWDLKVFSENWGDINFNKLHFKQISDINFIEPDFESNGLLYNNGKGWFPIQNFMGVYNGNNYSISGLYINRLEQNSIGFFGSIDSAKIENLKLTNFTIKGKQDVGGLCGIIKSSTINNCDAQGIIIGDFQIGGLIGIAENSIISNSSSDIDLTSNAVVGGFVSEVKKTNIYNSYSTGKIKCSFFNTGGFIAILNESSIDRCYSNTNIEAKDFRTGGFVASTVSDLNYIRDCFSKGNIVITTNHFEMVGGFVGIIAGGCNFSRNYSTGSITYNSDLKTENGFFGNVSNFVYPMENNFWNIETSGAINSNGNATGITNENMRLQSTFENADWDFDSIWRIDPLKNNGYPYLIWQDNLNWTGKLNTDWNNVANWNKGIIPDSSSIVNISNVSNFPTVNNSKINPSICKKIIIDYNSKLTIGNGNALTVFNNVLNNGEIIIEPEASFIVEGEISGTGISKVKLNLEGNNRNYYIGSPVSNIMASVFGNGTHSKFSHNPNEQRYYNLNNSTALVPTQGYVYRGLNSNNIEFSGVLNNSNYNVDIVEHDESSPFNGYNLVSNPYTSYLSFKEILNISNNVSSTMWLRSFNGNSNVFDTYNSESEIGTNNNGIEAINEFVAPMQGFWVQKIGDGLSGNLTINKSMRSHQTGVPLRFVSNKNIFRFVIENNGQTDEAVINFTSSAREDFEIFDSKKMYSNISAQVATICGNNDLVINSLPSYYDVSVPVKISLKENGIFTLKATQQIGLLQNEQIVLEDLLTNHKVSFNAGEKYTFKGNKEDVNRFIIHFGDIPLSVKSTLENTPIIIANNKQLTIKINEVNNAQISVYSLNGQLIENFEITNSFTQISTNYSSGIYLIEIINKGITTREKIIIQ